MAEVLITQFIQVDCKCNEIVLSHYPRKMICAVLDV